MKTTYRILWIAAVMVSAIHADECTEEKIAECLGPITEFEADVNSAVVIYLSEDDLREHCRLYELFNTCMKDVRPNCHYVDLLVFEGIDDAYHYLCDEAFDEYLRHRECFNNTRLHQEGEYCNATLTSKLNNLNQYETQDYKIDRICQYAEDYLDCVENAVVSFCGTEAGSWQRELDERSLRPLLHDLNCPHLSYRNWWDKDSDSSSLGIRLAIAVALTIVTIIILVLVILMCLAYRKRKLQQQTVQEQMNRATTHQVHYSNGGAGSTSILPPGLYPGDGAGPLPEKGVLPPPYTTDGAANPYPATPFAPPAYSDITSRAGAEGGEGAVGGYANPALSISDDPQYVDNANVAPPRGAGGSVAGSVPGRAGSSYSSTR